MYHYLDDKVFLRAMRQLSGEIMQCFCHILKTDYDIGANFYLVGSGAKNLIMQNETQPIDLDYNLNIVRCEDYDKCRYIKESAGKAFNKALNSYGWADCKDSESVFTTEKRCFKTGNQTGFSIDVCIVRTDAEGNVHRLKHKKTGYACNDEYYWNMAFNSKDIQRKAKFIKHRGEWQLVRDQYEYLKNRYLQRNDHNHPSYICYIEAVNNVYNMIR